MTLEQLGNLGEFIGAIGVVVSFVFLAIQVRHNTQAIRDSAERDSAEHTAVFLAPIIENREVARFCRLGLGDWYSLDEDDRMRFSMHLFGFFFFYQHLYSRISRKQVDLDYWLSQKNVILWYLQQPGVQHWWPKARSRFNTEFASFVDGEISKIQKGT